MPTVPGTPWPRVFTAALAALTRFWGGSQNQVYPLTPSLGECALFWALVDRFDADHFFIYDGAASELEYLGEDRAQVFPSRPVNGAGGWPDGPIAETEAPRGLHNLLSRRVAPMANGLDDDFVRFGGWDAPPYPFTDVGELVELPKAVINPETPLGDIERLLLAVEVGRLPPGLRQDLMKRNVRIDDEGIETSAQWRQFLFRRPRDPSAAYPLHLAEAGLAWYRRQALRPQPLPVVVGDDPWDFALFYALRRSRSLAYWIPGNHLEDEGFSRGLLAAAGLNGRAVSRISLITASSEAKRDVALAILRQHQENMGAGGAPRFTIEVGEWREFVDDESNRLFERDHYGLPQSLLLQAGATPPLPTPLPRQVATRVPTELRWITEVGVESWTATRHALLGSALLGGPAEDRHSVRAGSDGLAYNCPRSITIAGASLEASIARPEVRLWDLSRQLRTVAEDRGWQIAPSDKGIYARETVSMFGGVDELAGSLRSPEERGLLDTYLHRHSAAGGILLGDRRYLSLADFAVQLGPDLAAEALGRLQPLGVLGRGLILKCRQCRAGGFYRAAETDPTFRCVRCQLDQVPNRASWLNRVEPVWFYGLHEVVFLFLRNNGHVPFLAAHDRFRHSRENVAYAFELSVVDPAGQQSEIDLAVLEGSRLWVGEATLGRQLEKAAKKETARLARLCDVAAVLDAYGVILATSQPALAERTRERFLQSFKTSWPRSEYVEGLAVDAADASPV